MKTAILDSLPGHTAPADDPLAFTGWLLEVLPEIDTTNRIAASLPAWHAVRADTQSAGRGRTGRVWTSDLGGLWLSAVVPCPGPREQWALLPLAVGWALCDTFRELGVDGLRLRWPNDLLVGSRKLAGLLVERHSAHTAVVGLGLNVFNNPEHAAPELRDSTVRLADLVDLGYRDLDDVASFALQAIAYGHQTLLSGEFPKIAADLNRSWSEPRRVSLTLAGRAETVVGDFMGIDSVGRLRLRINDVQSTYDPTQVALLREL
jgi:BirA family transcriptional regulator, biotin operon repressor / biotin---[acetyl-CoA-carboxylase] ligase